MPDEPGAVGSAQDADFGRPSCEQAWPILFGVVAQFFKDRMSVRAAEPKCTHACAPRMFRVAMYPRPGRRVDVERRLLQAQFGARFIAVERGRKIGRASCRGREW